MKLTKSITMAIGRVNKTDAGNSEEMLPANTKGKTTNNNCKFELSLYVLSYRKHWEQ